MSIRRRRTGTAIVLCAPLVAGCGTATRVDFAPHSRPAAPREVSVYVGAGAISVDPRRLSPGPVQFDVTNQSGQAARLALTLRGAQVARTPLIEPGGTAQLKADLRGSGYGVDAYGGGAGGGRVATLLIAGRPRSGDSALLEP